MYKLSEIKELVKLVNQTSIQELEIENEGSRLCIRKSNPMENVMMNPAVSQQGYAPAAVQPNVQQSNQQPASAPEQASESSTDDKQDSNLHTIVSPMVGTFYASPSPSAPAFAKNGDKVTEKTVVCIIEAMKLMNEIEAEVKGEIVEILVENGQLVEFGQPLFLVK
jgi:acetyl-CoA carboxylase biotin carboxyl carrier protein